MSEDHEPVVAKAADLPKSPKVWPAALLSVVALGMGAAGISQSLHTASQQQKTEAHVAANSAKVSRVSDLQCAGVRLRQEIAPQTNLDAALKVLTARQAPQCLTPTPASAR